MHRARGEDPAVCSQQLAVEARAFIEWIPEPFIPQAGARYQQQTRIELAEGAGLLFFEWISPGRVARGEVFEYENLRWELDLLLAGKLVARERYTLDPADHSLTALRERFPAGHYLTVYVGGIPATAWPGEALDALTDERLYLGHGPVAEGLHVIRALCADSLEARALIGELRALIYAARAEKVPRLGRLV